MQETRKFYLGAEAELFNFNSYFKCCVRHLNICIYICINIQVNISIDLTLGDFLYFLIRPTSLKREGKKSKRV